MDPKEEESSLMQPLLQEQLHIQEQQEHIQHEQQQQTPLPQQQDQQVQQEHIQHEQQQQTSLQKQQQLLEQQLKQLYDGPLMQEEMEGEGHIHLRQLMQHVLEHVEVLHNHMRRQHKLLQQPQPETEPSFRVLFYQTTSMFLGFVVTLYAALLSILVARELFDRQWTIAIISTLLLCYSTLISYGLLGYYYRVNQDPAVHNRYVLPLRVSSYLTAVASLALLLVADLSQELRELLVYFLRD